MKARIPYAPHAGQRLFHQSPARFRVLACGARWGKDRCCIIESIRLTVELLQLKRPGLIPQVHGWFVAPNYPLAGQLWRELKELTPRTLLAKPPNEKAHRLNWKGGAVVEIKSADDPNSLVTVGLDWLVVTEAALVSEDAWEMALRPRLSSPQRAGMAIFNGTPKGPNWYHRLYRRGLDLEQPEWESWNFPTAALIGPDGRLERHPCGNPYVSVDEVAQARQDMPEHWFRQEYLAEFLSGEGTVFRNIRDRVAAPPTNPAGPLVAGADLAKHRDFSVFAVFDAEGRMVDMDRSRHLPYAHQAERLCSIVAKHGVEKLVIESNGVGEPFYEMVERDLHQRGLRCELIAFQTTTSSKRQMIESLMIAFERGQITILDDPQLVNELELFTLTETTSGYERFSAPQGSFDDCVMACGLAFTEVAALRRKPCIMSVPTDEQMADLYRPSPWRLEDDFDWSTIYDEHGRERG